MLDRINKTPVLGPDLIRYAKEVHELEPAQRDIQGATIVGFQIFPDADHSLSAYFRMEALAEIISEGRLLGWTRAKLNGAVMTNTTLFDAAGNTPLKMKNDRIVFSKVALLKRAFQLAIDLRKSNRKCVILVSCDPMETRSNSRSAVDRPLSC